MSAPGSLFSDVQRKLVTTYIHSRVGQIPEAVAALLADYDRLRDAERSVERDTTVYRDVMDR